MGAVRTRASILQHSWTAGGSAGAVVAGMWAWAAVSDGSAPYTATFTASLRPGLGRPFRALDAVCIQHLQQQVVKRHSVLALHAVEMLHAFVAAEISRRSLHCVYIVIPIPDCNTFFDRTQTLKHALHT